MILSSALDWMNGDLSLYFIRNARKKNAPD
jgi:hypothetical protein